jgi:hypothetical protein
LLALVIRRRLKEPERWEKVAHTKGIEEKRGSYAELFGNPRWRKNALIGLFLAIPGVVGLWGIGFFSGDLSRAVFREKFAPPVFAELEAASVSNPQRAATLAKLAEWEKNQTPKEQRTALTEAEAAIAKEVEGKISSQLSKWQAGTLFMQQIGAFLGMYGFGWMAQRVGRKPTFLLAYLTAMATTAWVFWTLSDPTDIFWKIPIMGVCQLSLFAGYAIYFPEIFPTYLRSTGTSFCYNVGRYVAAFGPTLFGILTSKVFAGPDFPQPLNWRYAGVSMSAVFLIGVVTLLFAEETKGKPLPE